MTINLRSLPLARHIRTFPYTIQNEMQILNTNVYYSWATLKIEVAYFSEDFVNKPICSVNLNIHLFRTVNSSVTLVSLFNTHVQFGGNQRDKYILVTNRKVTSNSVSRCIGLHCVFSVKLWTV